MRSTTVRIPKYRVTRRGKIVRVGTTIKRVTVR